MRRLAMCCLWAPTICSVLIDPDDTRGPSVTIRFPDLERVQDK
jgi:hypothetical protein